MSLHALGCREGGNLREGQAFCVRRSFFGAGGFASGDAFRHQKSVRRDAQRRVMMEAPPASSFVMAEPQFLFQLLIVAFN
jgi:hypothetical protein